MGVWGEQSLEGDTVCGEADLATSDWPAHLPSAFYVALEEFNRGEYFACHETLEALWIPERRAVRELYQGVLQIAVGCYHLTQRANRIGAVNLLERGARLLERATGAPPPLEASNRSSEGQMAFADRYGVGWRSLIAAADRLQLHLHQLDHAKIEDYDLALLPVIWESRSHSDVV